MFFFFLKKKSTVLFSFVISRVSVPLFMLRGYNVGGVQHFARMLGGTKNVEGVQILIIFVRSFILLARRRREKIGTFGLLNARKTLDF